MELAGRGSELNEHLIGVEALGRPPGYSTTDDSSVRRCAHTLRLKLEEAYATDLAGARVRIELPRGGYQPRFHFAEPAAPATATGADAPVRTRFGLPWLLAAFALGGLAGAAALPLWPRPVAARLDPVAGRGVGAAGAARVRSRSSACRRPRTTGSSPTPRAPCRRRSCPSPTRST